MAAQEDEGVNNKALMAVSSTGLIMVGFMMIVSGAMYLNNQFHFIEFDLLSYLIARLIICTLIVICAATTLSKGMLTTSIIMVTTAISILTFTLSYFIDDNPSGIQDPVLSVLLYIASLIMFKTRDYVMCAATLVYAVAMSAGAFITGELASMVLAVGLMVSGLTYSLCATAAIVQYECGIVRWRFGALFDHTGINDIAQTPYERSVPITSVTAGILFLFLGIATMDGYMYPSEVLPLAVILIIVLGMSIYMFTHGIDAEGVYFLIISVVNLLTYVPYYLGFNSIPTPFITVIIIPMLAVVGLSVKTRDIMLIVASVASLVNMLVMSLAYMFNNFYLEGLAPITIMTIALATLAVIMYRKGYRIECALILLILAVNLLTFIPMFYRTHIIPVYCLAIVTVIIAAIIAYRLRTKDTLLTVASSITLTLIAVMCAIQIADHAFLTDHFMQIAWIVTGVALLYHGVSRWLFICARREVIPLYSQNIKITDNPPPAPKPKKDPGDYRIIDVSMLILAALLLLHATQYINSVLKLIEVNETVILAIRVSLAIILLIMCNASLRRGMVTETLLYALASVSFMMTPVAYIIDEAYEWQIGMIFGLFILACGVILFHRGSRITGVATMLFAAGMEVTSAFTGDTSVLVSGIIILAAGILYTNSAVYNLGWAHQKAGYHRMERHEFSVRETAVTLGYLNLTIMMLTADLLNDQLSIVCAIMLAAITLGVGVYVVYRNVIAEGLLILFPTMLMLLAFVGTFLVGGTLPVPFYFYITFIMLCPLTVFIYRRNIAFVLITIILMAEGLVYCFCPMDEIGYIMVLPLIGLAIYTVRNWLYIEKQEHTPEGI